MESRDFITVARPPASIFENDTVQLQASEGEGVQGELFDRMEYPGACPNACAHCSAEGYGILAHFYDHAYPTKGQPYPQAVDAIQAPKKMFMGLAKFIKHHFLFSAFVLLLPNFLTKGIFKSLIRFFFYDYVMGAIKPYCFLAENRYCRSVRELRRAGFKVTSSLKTDDDTKDLLRCLLIALSNILEWDNAHRYRWQDIFGGEFNKEAFLKNPSKEISRLIPVQVGRERGWYDDKSRWGMIGFSLKLALMFSPFAKNLIKEFIKEVNLDEIKMDEGDEYHNLLRPDYDIHGWPQELRQKKFLAIRDKHIKENPDRIAEGNRARSRAESAAQANIYMQREKGVPFLLFFICPVKDGLSQVKMVETKFSLDNPKLKETCLEIIQGRGKTAQELEKEAEYLKQQDLIPLVKGTNVESALNVI